MLEVKDFTLKYPNIRKTALEIAYDNCGIRRDRTEEDMFGELDFFICSSSWGHYESYLKDIDEWLSTLSEENFNIACCGEHSEIEQLLKTAPYKTDDFLNDIFENVC